MEGSSIPGLFPEFCYCAPIKRKPELPATPGLVYMACV